VERFVARVKQLKVGDGLDAATQMGPCINEQQLQTVMSYVEIGKGEGAKLATGGHRLETGAHARGWFHEPTVFTDCNAKMRICQEEIFGPVVAVIPFGSFDEALEIANGVNYGLSASIYTRDVNNAFRAQRDLETGIVYVNAPTIGAETHLPFGGTKNTGNGHREAGLAGLLLGVEDGVRRLLGPAAARANRCVEFTGSRPRFDTKAADEQNIFAMGGGRQGLPGSSPIAIDVLD